MKRWLLRPGYPKYRTADGNQFSFRCRPHNEKDRNQSNTFCSVLFPDKPSERARSKLTNAWNWNLPYSKDSYYHALFPRAWTVYNSFQPNIRLQSMQISPVIANNYKESCYPVAVFAWEIDNLSDIEQDVSLMFTWENTIGLMLSKHGIGHENKMFEVTENDRKFIGINMKYEQRVICEYKKKKYKHSSTFADPMSYTIAVEDTGNGKISYRTSTLVTDEIDSLKLWKLFDSDNHVTENNSYKTKKEERTCGALWYSNTIAPKSKVYVQFSVAWDLPIIRFGSSRGYTRRYTRFFNGDNISQQIAINGLINWKDWNKKIDEWQYPILNDTKLSTKYKYGLFNELYYLVAGGSEWVDSIITVDTSNETIEESSSVLEEEDTLVDLDEEEEDYQWICSKEYGKFLYLESLEYLMYNTYDVHWYASFALAMNWPQIEITLQRDIAKATLEDYSQNWKLMSSGKKSRRKIRGAVPHDVGNPGGDPWFSVNSYNIQDISRWKDLNSKFILQTYRDYLLIDDILFLEELWPAIDEAIMHLLLFTNVDDPISKPTDKYNGESPYLHCMVENQGFPDQTYDAWSVTGCSAYCGGLWIACLQAAYKIAIILEKDEIAKYYSDKLKYAKEYYEKTLWNGSYYNYDSSGGTISDSIMSDQLAGNWYSLCCNLDYIVPKEHVESSLKVIYDYNLMKFENGKLGAVNGMRPNGKVDRSCLQSLEVWTGTCYSVASHMWLLGLSDISMQLAESVIQATYDLGYGFQTPEAWTRKGNYRAICYMRPLSIWSIQWAIQQKDKKQE